MKFHRFQAEAWLSDAQVIAMIGGGSAGKTTFGSFWMMREAEAVEDEYLITVETKNIANQSTLPRFLKLSEELGWGSYLSGKSEFRVRKNGSVIYVRTLDHPRLKEKVIEGIPARAVWMDEAGLSTSKAWKLARARGTMKAGRLLLTTKAYLTNWLYQDLVRKAGRIMLPDGSFRLNPDGFQNYFALCFTSLENPKFSRAEYDKAMKEMDPADFAVHFGGQFVVLRGRVYQIVRTIPREKIPAAFDDVVGGVDWGSTNPAALTVLGVKDGLTYQVAEFEQSYLGIDELFEIAKDFTAQWRVRKWFADPSEPTNIKYFNDHALECEGADGSSGYAISRVRGRMTAGRLFIAEDLKASIDYLESYHYPDDGGSKPVKKDDHLPNSLGSAVTGIESPEAASGTLNDDSVRESMTNSPTRETRWQNIIERPRSLLRR